ncbi:hypothetical protein C2E23DRAFT_169123 [Lenzites betulinus]|nr:hypothetical protein C2E23DRAFT_169123 [Lenzites betulinus]
MKSYIHAALHYHNISGRTPPEGNVYTPEDFGWNTAMLTPHYTSDTTSDTTSSREPRSGTPPYASAHILSTARVVVNSHGTNGGLQSGACPCHVGQRLRSARRE